MAGAAEPGTGANGPIQGQRVLGTWDIALITMHTWNWPRGSSERQAIVCIGCSLAACGLTVCIFAR